MLVSSVLLLSSLVAGVFGAARTSPPSGALVVAKSGGKYNTIQKAVNAAKANSIIFIQPGTYSKQVLIPASLSGLTIYNKVDAAADVPSIVTKGAGRQASICPA